MKIVINNCYGGYSLSPMAVKRLAELQGKECYFFKDGLTDEYKPISMEEASKTMFWSAFSVPNPGDVLRSRKEWAEQTMEERRASNELYEQYNLSSRPEPRTDPLLIQVVEEMGEKANGRCASLKIIEIPDDIDYEIDEYDGSEHVAEKHRTWS